MTAFAAQYDKDLLATVQNLVDFSLTCRPTDVIAFGKRFYNDELQGKSIEERSALHATHALPYLLCHSTSFQSFLCTLFCYHNFMALVDSKSMIIKKYQILNTIYNGMRSDFFQPIPIIDNVVAKLCGLAGSLNEDYKIYGSIAMDGNFNEYIINDFQSFQSFFEIPISSFYITLWLKCILKEFDETNYVLGNVINGQKVATAVAGVTEGSFALWDKVEITNKALLIAFIKRNSINNTELNKRVQVYWTTEKHKRWTTLLLQVLESSKYTKFNTYGDLFNILVLEHIVSLK